MATHRSHRPSPGAQRDPGLRSESVAWQTPTELTVRVSGLPSEVGTLSMHELLRNEGTIMRIELLEDERAQRTGVADVTFQPPPVRAFWLDKIKPQFRLKSDPEALVYTLHICPKPMKRNFRRPSPVNEEIKYPKRIELSTACALDFGFMLAKDKMMVMHSTDKGHTPIKLLLDLLRRRVDIVFGLLKLKSSTVPEVFKITIPLHMLSSLWKKSTSSGELQVIIHLESPAEVFRKTKDIDSCHNDGRDWHERSTWFRQTDIVHDIGALRTAPIMLRKQGPIINIGRWTTYRLTFKKFDVGEAELFNLMQAAMRDYNIPTIERPNLEIVLMTSTAGLWNWIDLEHGRPTYSLLSNDDVPVLPFNVRYQLEVCISQGRLNENNITRDFVTRLSVCKDIVDRLEAVAASKVRVFEPRGIFSMDVPCISQQRTLPSHCTRLLTARVTPTTICYGTPSVEMNNRVLRRFSEHSDRFLRVQFSGEKSYGKIFSADDDTQNAVYTRIKRCLVNGIIIGDRHFEFLASGNSQFKENGAYFFASTPSCSASDIRAWLGDFTEIKEISKYAARIGQCFSTTRAIHSTKVDIVPIEDVQTPDSLYTFTDGVGKISRFLAQVIASELKLSNASNDPPTVFQFRLAGYKGVLAICPLTKFREVHLRPSQRKFDVNSKGLEIIRYSSFSAVRMNRQLIILLKSLGIPDKVFTDKLTAMLGNLERAMHNERLVTSMLHRQVDPNQMTLTLASIIQDGFMTAKDPFTISLLHLWRAWNLKVLKEKAGIVIDESAFVLGCTDETQTLHGFYFAPTGLAMEPGRLPEIFLQVSDSTGGYRVIQETCIVGRNPSLHPGDIRIVRAIDVPALHHIKNAVVFPQTGDRDLPSMCSGGDLDGDDFFVIWDEALIPAEADRNFPAANYETVTAQKTDKPVSIDDMTTFFVNYMKNDQLGKIANAHLANADRLKDGAKDPRSLELAELHSRAVDYQKSGVEAKMSRWLAPREYPHFMGKHTNTYHSKRVLGKLYDKAKVEPIDHQSLLHLPFDDRVLRACEPSQEHLHNAAALKIQYDTAMRRIMAQHEIETEFEVWSTFVLKHAQISNDYTFHEEIGRIATSLREQYQKLCYEKAGGHDFYAIAPFLVAMYTVTSHEFGGAEVVNMTPKDRPLLSFPWIFWKELGRVARGESFPAKNGASTVQVNIDQSVKINQAEQNVDDATQRAVNRRVGQTLYNEASSEEVASQICDNHTSEDQIYVADEEDSLEKRCRWSESEIGKDIRGNEDVTSLAELECVVTEVKNPVANEPQAIEVDLEDEDFTSSALAKLDLLLDDISVDGDDTQATEHCN